MLGIIHPLHTSLDGSIIHLVKSLLKLVLVAKELTVQGTSCARYNTPSTYQPGWFHYSSGKISTKVGVSCQRVDCAGDILC